MSVNGLLINYQYCTGCHSCEMACRKKNDIPLGKWGIQLAEIGPWKIDDSIDNTKWEWEYIPVPTELCDLCEDRIAEGEKPSCVVHCQALVMEYGPVEELAQKMGKKTVIFTI